MLVLAWAPAPPEQLLHPLQTLSDPTLGAVDVLVLRDPSGYEHAVYASDSYEPALAAAPVGTMPDWEYRRGVLATVEPVPSNYRDRDYQQRRRLEERKEDL